MTIYYTMFTTLVIIQTIILAGKGFLATGQKLDIKVNHNVTLNMTSTLTPFRHVNISQVKNKQPSAISKDSDNQTQQPQEEKGILHT